ncbi:MAG: hypothetical protein H6806_04190 [Planctomycetes bacterium]|nr:hypothetical protein [Planctomycetota bacterium]
MSLFAPGRRSEVQAVLRRWADEDPAIVAGAVVGSEARDAVDRWSDIDLTFAVDDVAARDGTLARWTARMEGELQAVALFDVSRGLTIYRVFLLPDALQVDLSFSPAEGFGPKGPDFRLLFGTASPPPPPAAAPVASWLGEAVHHALRARIAVERGPLQAAFWIQTAAAGYLVSRARSAMVPPPDEASTTLPPTCSPAPPRSTWRRRRATSSCGPPSRDGRAGGRAGDASPLLTAWRAPDAILSPSGSRGPAA